MGVSAKREILKAKEGIFAKFFLLDCPVLVVKLVLWGYLSFVSFI